MKEKKRDRSEYNREYRLAHIDEIRAREKRYREENRGMISERERKRREADPEKFRDKCRRWRARHAKPKPSSVCSVCGSEFVKSNPMQAYCSPQCRKEGARRMAKAR